jgi:predicted transcriptional regulator
MLLPCEIAVKCLLPVLRATVVKELAETHHFKQQEIASLLGVTQTAVSYYIRNIRGKAIDIEEHEELMALTQNIAKKLATGKVSPLEFRRRVCETCLKAREMELMCDSHSQLEQSDDFEKCGLCSSMFEKKLSHIHHK